MKKVLVMTFFSLVMAVALSTSVYAMPLPMNNDIIKMSSGDNRLGGYAGGEFWLKGSNAGGDYAYISFCLEINEEIRFGPKYTVSNVSGAAELGGAGGAIDGKDPISDATKWLMHEYIFNKGGLMSFSGITNNVDLSTMVQDTIWYFEQEVTNLTSLASLVFGEGYSMFDHNPSFMSHIKVVNLVDQNGDYVQSQLIAMPIPEPATMLLFGAGIAGLAGVARRKREK